MQKYVDIVFPVMSSKPIPADHLYFLFSAISEAVPAFHNGGGFGLHPVAGKQLPGRELRLTEVSQLVVRIPVDEVGTFLPLSGQRLRIGGNALVECGHIPQIKQLSPAASLRSRLVTIKRKDRKLDADSFIEAARKQLMTLGVSEHVNIELPPRISGSGDSRTAKKTFSIKGREIVGFETRLHGLSAEESIAVQSFGVGGRRAMGCGLFKPFHLLAEHPARAQNSVPASEVKSDA